MSDNVIYVQGVEKAIQEKYGKDVVQDPRSGWDDKKEAVYQKQRKARIKKNKTSRTDKEDVGGFLLSRKLLNRKENRTCPICETYSFEIRDDVYVKKYSCCYNCYVQHVEGREERWEEKKRELLNDIG